MGVIGDWVQRHTSHIWNGEVSFSEQRAPVGGGTIVMVSGRLPSEQRPNRRRQPVRFKVAADVVAHVSAADGAEFERTGKQLARLAEEVLAAGTYHPENDAATTFEVDVDDHVLDR